MTLENRMWFVKSLKDLKLRCRLKTGSEAASFPVVLGDFGCDVTCQAFRENSPRTPRAIALGSKPPLVTRIARTGLGTRLDLRLTGVHIDDYEIKFPTRSKLRSVVIRETKFRIIWPTRNHFGEL